MARDQAAATADCIAAGVDAWRRGRIDAPTLLRAVRGYVTDYETSGRPAGSDLVAAVDAAANPRPERST